jgi:hypothetical protein
MSRVHPFRALRPVPEAAERVAAVPYDVVSRDEAAALADGNPLSFLYVSRAEIGLPPDTDPYSDRVYQTAARNFAALRERAPLVMERGPAVYLYRLQMGAHVQTGVAACYSLDEYDDDRIKKHERTRRDKEDDRTRHMLALRAQTGPVFLTYRATPALDVLSTEATRADPLFDFEAADGVGTRCGARRATRPSRSCARSPRCRSCTSPTGITARRAPRGPARSCDRRASPPTPNATRSSRWRFPTIKCRSSRTTASSAISAREAPTRSSRPSASASR